MDSFDHYDTAQIALKWNAVGNASNAISTANQRTGSRCLSIGGTGAGPFVDFANVTTVVVSTAYKPMALRNNSIIAVESNNAGAVQMQLVGSSAGILAVRFGAFGPDYTVTDPQFNMQAGVYTRYELKVVIGGGVSGSFELRVNGVVALAVSGINTNAEGTGDCNIMELGGLGGGQDSFHDDVYCGDDFAGDIIVVENVPSADGFYTQWTPNPGPDHFDNVNEIPPDSDTTYNSSDVVGQIDTFDIPNSGYTPPIQVLAVQTSIFARKDLAGTRLIAPLLRQGGVDQVGDDRSIGLTTYSYYRNMFNTNPCTGAAWQQSDLAALEIGVKVTG